MDIPKDCLSCAKSCSEDGLDGGFDRLFCVVKQKYVEEDDYCEEYN